VGFYNGALEFELL